MAIEYVEIRNEKRSIIGIIDTANSIIWHSVYFGVGDFEIYAKATETNFALLQRGYYVTRPDNDEVGIIEKIEITQNAQDGRMIIASGRFAKSILERRVIYNLSGSTNKATILTGNVESAARALVANNLISCSFDNDRNISFLQLGAHSGSTEIIVDEEGQESEKQVSCENLLEYTDALLQEYNLSAKIILDKETYNLQYVVFAGADRQGDIIFSIEFDNLSASDYREDDTNERNIALIGGEGEGIERFYVLLLTEKSGLQRREMWVDASSISKKYKDEQDIEHTYTDAEYRAVLKAEGKQQLAEMQLVESFSGTINVNYGIWVLNRDYFLGDIVTVQDNSIGKYANVRITEITEVQDENGYSIEAKYE